MMKDGLLGLLIDYAGTVQVCTRQLAKYIGGLDVPVTREEMLVFDFYFLLFSGDLRLGIGYSIRSFSYI
jgi:hypothetical protein